MDAAAERETVLATNAVTSLEFRMTSWMHSSGADSFSLRHPRSPAQSQHIAIQVRAGGAQVHLNSRLGGEPKRGKPLLRFWHAGVSRWTGCSGCRLRKADHGSARVAVDSAAANR